MKISVIKEDKQYVEFLMEGERYAFPNLLKQKLLENKSVEFVSCMLDHPTDTGSRFVLRTKGKTPKKVLEEAAKDVEKTLEDFLSKTNKILK